VPVSKDLSYPVGAEIVSKLLAGVPQYELLNIYFAGYVTAATLRRRIARGEPVGIFEASYYHARPALNRPRSFRGLETWELRVHPIPRERKFETRRLLVEDGLQRVRSWLTLQRPPVWYEGTKRCSLQIVFDDGSGILHQESD